MSRGDNEEKGRQWGEGETMRRGDNEEKGRE